MTQVVQSIKNIGLFLFGVVMIVIGHRVNGAHAQAKVEAEKAKSTEVPEKTVVPEMPSKAKAPARAKAPETTSKKLEADKSTTEKPRTKIEKATPEKASATKYEPKAKKPFK